jgi:hypothetical protein
MEPTKPTKSTQKTGESIAPNTELLRQMVKMSNNSAMTYDAAKLLTNKLEKNEMSKLLEWMYHANRQQETKNIGGFKRW